MQRQLRSIRINYLRWSSRRMVVVMQQTAHNMRMNVKCAIAMLRGKCILYEKTVHVIHARIHNLHAIANYIPLSPDMYM